MVCYFYYRFIYINLGLDNDCIFKIKNVICYIPIFFPIYKFIDLTALIKTAESKNLLTLKKCLFPYKCKIRPYQNN